MEIDDKKIPLIRLNLNFIERGIVELEKIEKGW